MEEQTNIKPTVSNELILRKYLKLLIVVLALLFFSFLFYKHWFSTVNSDLFQHVIEHYAVFLLIPCAGFAAFLLVVIFEGAYGHIKISVLQVNFEGASAPLIMYIFCFMSIILSIKLLW